MHRLALTSGINLLLSALACLAQGPVTWEQRAPIGSTFIKEIAGRIWVGGATLMISDDAKTWKPSPPILGMPFLDIIEADGRIIAVGDSGKVAISEDGTGWTRIQTPSRVMLKGIAYGAGLYVAVGQAGTILTSADGSAWDTVPRPAMTNLSDIAFGGGLFAAVGGGGEVWTSPDGKAWTIIKDNFRTRFLNAIAWGHDGFLAVGGGNEFHYSADGRTWRSSYVSSNDAFTSVAYGDSMYLVSGDLGNLYSVGKKGWVSEWGIDLCGNYQVGFAKGRFFVRSCQGSLVEWHPEYSVNHFRGTEQHLGSVAWNSTGYAAVGQRSLLFSSDGLKWDRQIGIDLNAKLDIRGVCAGRGLSFRAVGGRTDGTFQGFYASKVQGMEWNHSYGGSDISLKATAFGNDRFVDLGAQARFDSSASEWMQIGGLAFCNGRFLATGALGGNPKPGAVALSTDGKAWTQVKGIATQKLQSAAYGAGRFVAVGDSGTIAVSQDGSAWVQLPAPTRLHVRAVAFGGGCFLALANGFSFTNGGAFLVSVNGMDWEVVDQPAVSGLRALTYGDGGFIVVGDYGRIYRVEVDLTAVSTRTGRTRAFGGIQMRRTPQGLSIYRPDSPWSGPVLADLLSPTGRRMKAWELRPQAGILHLTTAGLPEVPAFLRLRDPRMETLPATVRILPKGNAR